MPNTQFASRAGEKLQHAVTEFNIDITGKICADFGSSVGGFVDCLLKNGALKVYAVETGYGELAWVLRQNPKVVVMEKTNAMHVTLPEKMDIITNDTSWTKQEKILPNILNNLKENGLIITLIKPHYEASPWQLKKGKLEEGLAEKVATDTLDKIKQSFPVTVLGFTKSPIVGGKGGNSEYLAVLKKETK